MSIDATISETLDVTGLNCPMPVIKTKQAADGLAAGEILEVLATDPGSMSDIRGWAESTAGFELVEQVEDDEQYRHYVRSTDA